MSHVTWNIYQLEFFYLRFSVSQTYNWKDCEGEFFFAIRVRHIWFLFIVWHFQILHLGQECFSPLSGSLKFHEIKAQVANRIFEFNWLLIWICRWLKIEFFLTWSFLGWKININFHLTEIFFSVYLWGRTGKNTSSIMIVL